MYWVGKVAFVTLKASANVQMSLHLQVARLQSAARLRVQYVPQEHLVLLTAVSRAKLVAFTKANWVQLQPKH
jgi:hypothetical protein